MLANRDLRAPWLPQMNNNGIVDADDLEQGFIYVLVPAYSNMALGDQVVIYFDSLVTMARIVDTASIGNNILFSVPESLIPDGVYSVYYTAMDVVGNASTSANSLAVVSRDGTRTLVAPIFVDAVNNILTLDNVLANEGTHVRVPVYQGIQAGDIVELNYLLYGSDGEVIPEGSFTESHTVVYGDLAAGYITLVPESKIFLPTSTRAISFYRVTRVSGGAAALSFDASVALAGAISFLEKPYFTDALNGWLTQSEVSGGINVHINRYDNIQSGDVIRLLWFGFDENNNAVATANGSESLSVTQADIALGVIRFMLPRQVAQDIYLGRIDAYYRVTNNTSAVRVSYTGSALIDMKSITYLPAPIFPQADDGVIETETLESDGALRVQIAYASVAIGDRVDVVISGRDSDGNNVSAADYQYSFTVNVVGVQNISVPLSTALAVGSNGFIYAEYTVTTLAGDKSYSLTGNVMIEETDQKADDIQFRCTNGAPVYDYASIHVTPYNYGFVKAPAGTRIRVSCGSTATILDGAGSSYDFTVNTSGVQSFRVQSSVIGLTTLLIQNLDNAAQMVTGYMTFNNYQIGNGKVQAIANTTGALPDGMTPCSIYLLMAAVSDRMQPITSVRVSVPAPLQVAGYAVGETAEISLNSDNSAQINILSSQSVSSANVMITSPQSSATLQMVSLTYSGF